MKYLIIFLMFFMFSCGLVHKDKLLIVHKIEKSGHKEYKYRYYFEGEVKSYTVINSNQVFNVGDTLKLSK
jgi:hypothetical protein